MNQSTECLDEASIDSLLQGNLAPHECRLVQEHLENCEHCRNRVESTIGSQQWWDDIASSLSDGAATLGAVPPRNFDDAGTLEVSDPIASLGETRLREKLLDLLGPTDDPNMLGRIGSYEIVGLLGQGGMGVVFKGFDRSLNRFVAIKMLLPHLAASGAARKRFAREAQAVAAVVDDHVMAIHCVDQWQGVPYLVMTYSRGITLQKRLSDNGPLEVREILRIGMQAAKGLAAAHAQGIVHRDIKPANIFLDQNVERVQLMDFGLARAVDDASLTRTGVLAGTPQYMSPEQARAETVDHRSDLFSLGSVMYAMCTGHAPFRAESSYSVLRLITDKEPRPIREINPDVPVWLCRIISKLMAKQGDDRFSSAQEVAQLLEDCLAHVQQPDLRCLPSKLNMYSKPFTNSRILASRDAKMKRLFPVVISIIALVFLLAFVAQEDHPASTKIPSPTPTIANTANSRPLYKKGDPAFPLQSRFWIEGQGKWLPKDTNLASFKGRAVFMVFTGGNWCSACKNAKPIYQEIREEFDEKDVAFVAIHTPELSDHEFEEWVSGNSWFQFATIDRSQDDSNPIQGKSANLYQVTGFPSVIILDREGRISYSDELMRRDMNREQFELVANEIARELGIVLPLEKLGNEERRSAFIKISTRLLSKHLTIACNGDRDATSQTANTSDITSADISAVHNQNLAGLAEVHAEWQIRKTPGPGAIRGVEYQRTIGKKNVEAGNRDPAFASMAASEAPQTTEWWGQLVVKGGAGQLAFVNPLIAGTPTPAMPLPLPLSSDQLTADMHKGWSVFAWDNGVEGIRCMIGQRQRGLLTGAKLKEFPQSAEFEFPPLLAPPREKGGIQHPYDSFFSGPFSLARVVDLDGHSCQLVERLGDPVPVDETALPESLRGRYKVLPRLRAWLDIANAYLPIRIESDQLALVDDKEVQMHKGSIAEQILTAKLSRIDIEGSSVVYPTKISVETRRIDPLFQGPYEDDILGILSGRKPLPDYPYVIDWSVNWDIKVAPAKVDDRDLALEFPDRTFYMDYTHADRADGVTESLAPVPKTVVSISQSRSWYLWISMSLFLIVFLLLAKRKLSKKRV